MKKNLFLTLLVIILILILPKSVNAAGLDLTKYTSESLSEAFMDESITGVNYGNYSETGDKVTIYLFRGKGCLNCINFLNYIKDTLIPKYGDRFKVVSYKVAENGVTNANFNLLNKTASFLNKESEDGTYATPYIVIGDKAFSGYIDTDKKTQIETIIQSNTKYNVLEEMVKGISNVEDNKFFTENGIAITSGDALSSIYTLKVSLTDLNSVKLDGFNYIVAYDITMYNGSIAVPLNDGLFNIKIPVSTKYDTYKVAYIKNGNILEEFDATYENGFISFTTTHLSEYAVYGKNNIKIETSIDKVENEKNPNTLDNIQIYGMLFVLGIIAILGSIVLYKQKLKYN